MNEDTTSTSFAEAAFEGESITGDEWKNEAKIEKNANSLNNLDDRADLSAEETIEIDNWLLGQGIDSGSEYVAKLSESISPSELSSEIPETKTRETEIISPRVIEYLENQDPEIVLDQISKMTDDQLDEVIEVIEIGEIDNLKQVFETALEINPEITTEIAPQIIEKKSEKMKMNWESDPKLPDFKKIDSNRRAELKSILVEHRKSSEKTKKAKNAGEAKAAPETLKLETEDFENNEKQKASGVVAYDILPDSLLRDVKIVLVERSDSEGWKLPQTIIRPDSKNEQRDTEEAILESYEIEIDIDEKIAEEKETLIKTTASEVISEKDYYVAESDSTKKLKRPDMQWVTLADIQKKDFNLTVKDLNIIATAVEVIKKKMESKSN